MLPSARAACVLACLLAALPASAQEQPPQQLRLDGLGSGSVRGSVTEAWGLFDLALTNFSDEDRQARVLFFYEGHEDLQYGRDLWVPARSSINSWLLAGPAPAQPRGPEFGRAIRMLLYDRTDGTDVWVRPRTEEKFRSRVVTYRPRDPRDPYTAMILDPYAAEGDSYGKVPQPPGYNDEVTTLVRAMRGAAQMHRGFAPLVRGPLPLIPEAYDGVDHLVIASNRVADEPAGLRAIRQWVMRGGKVWVLLDRVDPDSIAPLLGDALDFHLVERLTLTAFRVEPPGQKAGEPEQNHERAVGFARVLLPGGDEPRYALDGWPVWFTRNVGRGKVVFTTLGPRGWTRPIQPKEKPLFADLPNMPLPRPHLEVLASQLHGPAEEDPFRPEALEKTFRQPLADEIGYSVLGLGTVAAIFGGFLACALALVLGLRGARRRESLGWLAPGLALVAAALFVFLGERSRRAAAPTVAAGQVVDVVPGVEEASVQGVLAVYRPDGGAADLGAEQGGLFEIDRTGTEGQTRRFLASDLGAWRWDGLSLPAGVRLAPFRYPAPTGESVRAVARFGPAGLEGKLSAGSFRNVSDAVLLTFGDAQLAQGDRTGPRPLAVALEEGGTFRVASQDALPPDRYLAGTLLSDRQQRRQELYRQFLKKPPPYLRGRPVLFAWADPIETHFRLAPAAREAGDALLVIPLEVGPAGPDARVTIPAPLVSVRRVREGISSRPAMEGDDGLEQHLRFQVPASALPMRVERVRLLARIDAPSRQVIVSAPEGAAFTEAYRADGPLDPIRVEIDRPGQLALDPEGGLHLRVRITDLPGAKKTAHARDATDSRWKIRYLELEVVGSRQ